MPPVSVSGASISSNGCFTNMSRSGREEKVNQGHRKSYSRMKKYGRHRSRQALQSTDTTIKDAKVAKHVQ